MRHHRLDVQDLQQQLVAGELTAESVVESCAKQMGAWEQRVRAFVGERQLMLNRAREEARRLVQWPRGERVNVRLYGIPIAYKDIIDVSGYPTEGGCKAYENRMPNRDAWLVARYRAAGSIAFGKTTTHELAAGVTTPQTHNPYGHAYVAGGSSGGSAVAVASGMVPVAVGSDTGGSGRIPAAFCGVIGFKPTYGQIPLDGFMERAASLDTVAFLGQSVRDVRLLYQVANGTDQPAHRPAEESATGSMQPAGNKATAAPIRIGFPDTWVREWCTNEIRSYMNQLLTYLKSQGVECVPVELPDLQWAMEIRKAVLLPEFANAHRNSYAEKPALFGPEVATQLERGWKTPAPDYVRGLRDMAEFAGAWQCACEDAGVLVVMMPTTPCVAPPFTATSLTLGTDSQSLSVTDALTLFTSPVNLARVPAISVPAGMATSGVPFGLQLVGRAHEDMLLLSVAQTIFEWIHGVNPVTLPRCD